MLPVLKDRSKRGSVFHFLNNIHGNEPRGALRDMHNIEQSGTNKDALLSFQVLISRIDHLGWPL